MHADDTPDWSDRRVAQDEALARAALPRWGLPPDTPLRLVNLSENATFAVDDQDGGSFLRVGRPSYQSPDSVRSELAWAAALRRDAAVVTPVPIPTRTGQTILDAHGPAGTRHLVRFEPIPGREPPLDDLDRHARALGRLAATLHTHVAGWARPPWFTRFDWDLPAILGPRPRWGDWRHGLGVGPEEAQVLGRAAHLVRDRLLGYGTGPDRYGLVHADMRLANLLVQDDRIAIIDFDDCGFSWFLFDLAATLSFTEHDPRVPQWCDQWLTGYRQVRALPPDAEAMAPTFILLRRLMLLAWLASHSGIALSAQLGAGFTTGSCDLAEAYLTGRR